MDFKIQFQQLQQKYKTFFNNTHDAIIIHNLDGEIVDVNNVMLKIYQVTKEEAFKLTIRDISSPNMSMEVAGTYWERTLKGEKVLFEWEAKRPNEGGLFFVEVSLQRLTIDNKDIIFSNIRDISKIKENEKIIKKSELRYRTLVESSLVGICIVDFEHNFRFTNQKFSTMLGYTQEELIGQKIFKIIPKDLHKKVADKISNRRSGESETYELPHLKKDGSLIDMQINASPYKNIDGEIIATMSMILDISRRKEAEENLKESEQQFRLAFENSGIGKALLTLNGTYFKVNNSLCKMLGYNKEELLSKFLIDITLPEDIPKSLTNLENLISGKLQNDRFVFRQRYQRKSGEIIFTKSMVSLHRNKNHEPLHLIIETEDITKEINSEKEKMTIAKLNSLGILAGGIAHDFNNFLMALSGNLQLAQIEEQNGRYLDQMQSAINRASSLAQKLLTFSKGGAPVKEFASIADIVIETTNFTLEGSNILPKYEISSKLMKVNVDTGQLSQVIQNLIENAKFAMPNGGNIDIKIENKRIKASSNDLKKKGQYIKIEIKDYGTGISAKNLKLIFDPYFTTKEEGNGLGLSICYSVMQKHDGYIEVKSTPGIGTTFDLYIPAIKTETPQNKKKKPLYESNGIVSGNGEIILIMDDDPVIRKTIKKFLEKCGYCVIEAKNGEDAISKLQNSNGTNQKIDLAIMDLTIPGAMGGKEAIIEMKKIDPNLKSIVSSGYNTDPVMGDPTKFHFTSAISKPYNFKKLSNLISELLTKN